MIDLLLIDHSLPVRESQGQSYIGMYGFVTMDLSITVLCTENIEGHDFTECVPGFAGTDCQTNIEDYEGVNCSGNGQCLDGVNSFLM